MLDISKVLGLDHGSLRALLGIFKFFKPILKIHPTLLIDLLDQAAVNRHLASDLLLPIEVLKQNTTCQGVEICIGTRRRHCLFDWFEIVLFLLVHCGIAAFSN